VVARNRGYSGTENVWPPADIDGGTIAMGKASKYSGPLATPIDLRKLPLEGDLGALVFEEISKKIPALIDHYQIDRALPAEQILLQLVFHLARDHVPGFRISSPRKRGAKPKWTLDECRALVDAVNAHKTPKGMLKAAITKAMKRPEWRWSREVHKVPSIETRYHEAVRTIQLFEFLRSHSPEESFAALMTRYGPPGKRSSRKRTTKTPG
jgi:hypothetical protein